MTALSGAGRIEAHDIEEYRESTPPWDVIPRQMSPGRFSALTEYLQAFGETLGITPLRYMRWHRMNQAYKELCTSDPTFSQVTKVALRLGFNDLGRFGDCKKD